MRVVVSMLLLLGVLGSIGVAPASAQGKQGGAAETIADQPWHPPGYRDLRIAAARQMATFPRDPRIVVFRFADNPPTYDVVDCNSGVDLPEGMDPYQAALAEVALDVARMRFELRRLGYRKEIYEQPLLEYEREALADIEEERALGSFSETAPTELDASEDAQPEEPVDYSEWQDRGTPKLAREMNARRTRLQPRLPEIIYEGGCGAGEADFKIKLVPANGQLWLINAFAFRVCERKVGDPWNHNACGWTQYSDGEDTMASGRYMFEARWPDGTVRRGAKILQGDMASDEEETIITFRRN